MSMPPRIDGQFFDRLAATDMSNLQDFDQNQDSGSFRGTTITVQKSQISLLTDAAEELSSSAAIESGDEEKTEKDREIKPEKKPYILGLQEIENYLDSSQSKTIKEMTALIKLMMAAQNSPMQLVQQSFKNPTQQYLALQYALHEGQATRAPEEVLAAIRDALAELEHTSGSGIRADLNTINAASQFSDDGEKIEEFQTTYRDVVLGETALGQTLKLALERFGENDFKRGLELLMQAMGHDLAATNSSISPTRLQALIQDIYQLQVMGTILERCQSLVQRLTQQYGVNSMIPLEVLKELVAITGEKWIVANRFLSLTQRFKIAQILAQIDFLTNTLGILRNLPPKIYDNMETRGQILEAAQSALDETIEKEESEEIEAQAEQEEPKVAGNSSALKKK